MNKKKRIVWLDSARGIGILMVVLIHAATTVLREKSSVARFLYEINFFAGRQLLFCLTGITYRINFSKYKHMEPAAFIKKKAMRILAPYVTYAVIVSAFFYLCNIIPAFAKIMSHSVYGRQSLSQMCLGFVSGDNSYASHLWFLYDLFIFEMLTYVVCKITNNPYVHFIIAGLFWFVLVIRDWGSLIAITNILLFYGCFIFGMFIHTKEITNRSAVISLFVGYGYFFLNYLKFITIPNANADLLIKLLFSMFAVYGFLGVAKKMSGIVKKLFSILGKRSMDIYIFQQPFWGSCVGVMGYQILHLNAILVLVMSIVLSLAIPLAISRILDDTKYLKKLFGRT